MKSPAGMHTLWFNRNLDLRTFLDIIVTHDENIIRGTLNSGFPTPLLRFLNATYILSIAIPAAAAPSRFPIPGAIKCNPEISCALHQNSQKDYRTDVR